ncbi:ECF transporter S component [Microbacterium sp. VKM Ac-2870]|uniref:ECF transporter S component n=1 Tax=Microbacterium sp. VKM Ac-2870 TaxID=2783825 RepID=UPI00188C0219|nr:ECF transporter S component [Microbacterium sp. VKM Ac-2870]MBF4562726.1 ECF transporter S component [Microbacterium sp. VKM Ac-2870]
MGKVTTAYLLTCAAIGVAGGIVLAAGWSLSLAMFVTMPFVSVAIAGLWVLPAVVALRLLQRPFAGLLVGLISGLVLAPFYTVSAVATTLFWSFFPELPFLATLYRRWATWLHYAGAVTIGIAYPILAAQSFDLWSMSPPLLVGFIALCAASCVGGTALGIVLADRLRAAGVARLARHRATV